MTEYTIYKGEEIICSGTKEECAAVLGVKPSTIQFYASPTWERKYAKRKKPERCVIAVRL